ncbi:hypothetical protein B296_00027917, partial [Ensete ventricosum]
MAASSHRLKTHTQQPPPPQPQTQPQPQQPNRRSNTNAKRRKRRETLPPHVVSSDGPWCCATSSSVAASPTHARRAPAVIPQDQAEAVLIAEVPPSASPSPLPMDASPSASPAASAAAAFSS